MKATQSEIDKILPLLEATPRRIAAGIEGMDEAALHTRPVGSGWSAAQVVAHLRACQELWGQSIYAMLAEDHPEMEQPHPRRWAKEQKYAEQPFYPAFRAFAGEREKLLRTLSGLRFEDWSRGAAIDGRRHTVFSQSRRMAKHEQEHCEQITQIVAEARREARNL